MSMYPPHTPFTRLAVTSLTLSGAPQPLASAAVLDGLARGRNGIEIVNTTSGTVYLGDSTVTEGSGLPIGAGESRYLPVTRSAVRALYITGTSGTITLAEYFA